MSVAPSTPPPSNAGPARIGALLIVVNPASGGFRRHLVEQIAEEFRAAGRRADIHYTTRAGEITQLLRAPDFAYDAIAVHGGDGTIGEAVAGLHERSGDRPALLVIPGGTANVLACEMKLPRRAREIVALALAGHTRPLFYALANGRPFFLMASAGFDAAVVHAVSPAQKRRFGKLAFVAAALRTMRAGKTSDLRIDADGKTVSARLAIVTNASCYGGPNVLTRATSVDRPGLRLVLLPRDNAMDLLRAWWSIAARLTTPSKAMPERPAQHVRVTSTTPVPVQIDGDAFGTTPLHIEPVAEPLRILAPR